VARAKPEATAHGRGMPIPFRARAKLNIGVPRARAIADMEVGMERFVYVRRDGIEVSMMGLALVNVGVCVILGAHQIMEVVFVRMV